MKRACPVTFGHAALGAALGFLVASAAHAAVDRAKVDALNGAGGVAFREILSARKDAKSWQLVAEKNNAQYFERGGEVPPFMGTRVDKVVAVVGKKSRRVGLVALQFDERARCQAVKDALDKTWGQAAKVREGSWEWQGDKVEVSLEGDPAGDCTLFCLDRGWNDSEDSFR